MKENPRNAGKLTQAEIARRDSEGKDLRPEMIERGRRLLANPNWPDMTQARDLARAILPSLY